MATLKPFDLDEAKRQFKHIKATLINSLPLRPVPTNATLQLYSDFSKNGIGAVVTWYSISVKIPVISRFLSRCLKGAEERYSAIEGEALASLFVISQAHADILKSESTTVFTDHQPLIGAVKNYHPEAPQSPRLLKMLGKLTSFNVQFKYLS